MGLQDVDDCVLCGQESETCEHMFLGCILVLVHVVRPNWPGALASAKGEDLPSWCLISDSRHPLPLTFHDHLPQKPLL